MTFYNVSDGKIFLRKYLHTVTNVQPARDKRVVVWQISFTIVLLVRSLKDYGFECLISRFVETPPPGSSFFYGFALMICIFVVLTMSHDYCRGVASC